MSEVRRDQDPKKQPKLPENTMDAGVLKEKDQRDLESRILTSLKGLSNKLTKKDINALLSRIEASSSLEGLRKELVKEKKLDSSDLSDELLQTILDLIKESRDIAKGGIEELKLELSRLNTSLEYDVDKELTYLTQKFPWIKKLEDSELGKNIVLDITGIAIGAIDSAHAIFKFLMRLIMDIVRLPADIITEIRGSKK